MGRMYRGVLISSWLPASWWVSIRLLIVKAAFTTFSNSSLGTTSRRGVPENCFNQQLHFSRE
jgi:hypothetical protein